MENTNVIAYIRVSTEKQGETQNGLNSQKREIANYCKTHKLNIIEFFIEVESGGVINRPRLNEAIIEANKNKCRLIVHRLDRLSRLDPEAFYKLKNSLNLGYISIDNPDSNKLLEAIQVAMSEEERKKIRERTKLGIAVARLKYGGKWGTPENMTEKGRKMGPEAMQIKSLSRDQNIQAAAVIRLCVDKGLRWAKITEYLNDNGFKTVSGKRYCQSTVKRIYDRFYKFA